MADITATHSHKTDEWETPAWLINLIIEEFGPITLDPCCTRENIKGSYGFTKQKDGLSQPWSGLTYVNPPYSEVGKWAKKSYEEALAGNAMVLFLCAARTDTRWWWDYARKGEVRFINGRLRFSYEGQPTNVSAPFPSALIVFRRGMLVTPSTVYWEITKEWRK